MERRRHPNYVKSVAKFSFGLLSASFACLVIGMVLRRFNWSASADVLQIGGAVGIVGFAVSWFNSGESTTCPQCGRPLAAEGWRFDNSPLVFVCPDCEIEWDTGTFRGR